MKGCDTQQVEILGRHRLIDELIRAGVEVAMPIRDRGVDLLAYVDIDEQVRKGGPVPRFSAVPIQMKAASGARFSLSSKYERIANLLLVYIWEVGTPQSSPIFAMTYAQALAVARDCGWTRTESWKRGHYAATTVSKAIRERLEPFRMTTSRWKPLIREAAFGVADPALPSDLAAEVDHYLYGHAKRGQVKA